MFHCSSEDNSAPSSWSSISSSNRGFSRPSLWTMANRFILLICCRFNVILVSQVFGPKIFSSKQQQQQLLFMYSSWLLWIQILIKTLLPLIYFCSRVESGFPARFSCKIFPQDFHQLLLC